MGSDSEGEKHKYVTARQKINDRKLRLRSQNASLTIYNLVSCPVLTYRLLCLKYPRSPSEGLPLNDTSYLHIHHSASRTHRRTSMQRYTAYVTKNSSNNNNSMKGSIPGKLTVADLVKKFAVFYGNWIFVTACTSALLQIIPSQKANLHHHVLFSDDRFYYHPPNYE